MMRVRFLLLVLPMVFMPAVRAADLWGATGFSGFCARLPAINPEVLKQAVGDFLPVVEAQTNLTVRTLRVARFEDVNPVLEQAAKNAMGVLDVFTQRDLADAGACRLFLDRATLAAIDARYDLHGVWRISAPIVPNNAGKVRMNYLMVGQGHLVIGYPGEARVAIEDESGARRTYRYEPLITADIVNEGLVRGLFDVRTLAAPAGPFQPFEGPRGSQIHAFKLAGHDLLAQFTWGLDQERQVSEIPIEVRDHQLAKTVLTRWAR